MESSPHLCSPPHPQMPSTCMGLQPHSPLAWMEVVVMVVRAGGGGGAMLSFAPAWCTDANGLTQESGLDWLFWS